MILQWHFSVKQSEKYHWRNSLIACTIRPKVRHKNDTMILYFRKLLFSAYLIQPICLLLMNFTYCRNHRHTPSCNVSLLRPYRPLLAWNKQRIAPLRHRFPWQFSCAVPHTELSFSSCGHCTVSLFWDWNHPIHWRDFQRIACISQVFWRILRKGCAYDGLNLTFWLPLSY